MSNNLHNSSKKSSIYWTYNDIFFTIFQTEKAPKVKFSSIFFYCYKLSLVDTLRHLKIYVDIDILRFWQYFSKLLTTGKKISINGFFLNSIGRCTESCYEYDG